MAVDYSDIDRAIHFLNDTIPELKTDNIEKVKQITSKMVGICDQISSICDTIRARDGDYQEERLMVTPFYNQFNQYVDKINSLFGSDHNYYRGSLSYCDIRICHPTRVLEQLKGMHNFEKEIGSFSNPVNNIEDDMRKAINQLSGIGVIDDNGIDIIVELTKRMEKIIKIVSTITKFNEKHGKLAADIINLVEEN